MGKINTKELLEAGVHFGHLKRKWNPNMAPYIFMEKNGIHIIDLNKTAAHLEEAANALKQIAVSGKKIMFVATKKQAKEIVENKMQGLNMPYVTERWPGGMLTNFATIRKAVRKMATIDKMATDGTLETMSKRERLQVARQRAKLEKNLGSVAELTRLPAAIFIVDINKEHIAVAEARKLNVTTFAIVDTNSNPKLVDFPIPANDDATKSIEKIMDIITEAIKEGLSERKAARIKQAEEKAEAKAKAEEKAKAEDEKAEEEKAETIEQGEMIEDAEDEKEAKKSRGVAKKKKSTAQKEKTEASN